MTRTILAAAAASADDLTGLVGIMADLVAAMGAWGVALAVAIENVFPPIPSEAVLPFAGFVVGRDGGSPWVMVAAATAGSVLGAVVLYEMGRGIGQERTRRWLVSLPLVEAEEVDRAIDWFARHGRVSVLLGRCVPVVRCLVSLPAGADGMPRVPFIRLTTAGSLVWNTLWVFAGHALGRAWTDAARYSGHLSTAILVAVLVVLARFLWTRRERISLPGR